ncbi:hypothetical protein ACNPQM_36010, partial [Streptomyces sp. NPDC056231]
PWLRHASILRLAAARTQPRSFSHLPFAGRSKCPVEDRAELIAAEPEKFFTREGHDDTHGWLRVRLAALDDVDELTAILADSWRQAATRKLQDAHPELGLAATDGAV